MFGRVMANDYQKRKDLGLGIFKHILKHRGVGIGRWTLE